MAQFDPYRKWLGIPPKEQPPNHYRLLGIGVFESDPDVISNAADRQMAHVRTYQSGKFSALSQRILNELSAARVCLLDPARKEAYDNDLRQHGLVAGGGPPGVPPAAPPPVPPPGSAAPPQPPQSGQRLPSPPPPGAQALPSPFGGGASLPMRRRKTSVAGPMAVLMAVLVGICGIALWAVTHQDGSGSGTSREKPSGGGKRPIVAEDSSTAKRPVKDPADGPRLPRPRPKPPEGRNGSGSPSTTPGPAMPHRVGLMQTLPGHKGPVASAVFAAQGEFVLSGGEDGTVRIWDLFASSARDFPGNGNPVQSVDLSPNGQHVLATSGRPSPPSAGSARLYLAASNQVATTIDLSKPLLAWSACFLADEKQIALACQDGTIRVIDAAKGTELRSLGGHAGPVRCVAVARQAGKTLLLSGGDDQMLRLWQTTDDKPQKTLKGHKAAVLAVAISADGRRAVSGGADKLLIVWNLETGRPLHQLEAHVTAIHGVAIAPDGASVLSAAADGTLKMWRVADGTEVQAFSAHEGGARAVAYATDGRRAVTAGNDGLVRIWGLPDPLAPSTTPGPSTPPDKPAPVAGQRPAPPPAAVQKSAEQRVREVFQREFEAADKPAGKLALAQKLLSEGQKPQSDPAAAFVLLRLARETAVELGEMDVALAAVDELDKLYEVEAAELKAAAFEALAAGQMPLARRKALVQKALAAVDDAVAADRFEAAVKLARLARDQAAGKIHEGTLTRQAAARLAQVEELRQEHQVVAAAFAALAKDPRDPAANLAIGKYYAFAKGDWTKALPRLAASGDAALRATAEKELAAPAPPAERLALGDSWWAAAEKQEGDAREQLRRRAAFWYKQVEADLMGLDQTKVKQRLAEVDEDAATAAAIDAPPGAAPAVSGLECREGAKKAALLQVYGGTAASEAAVERALDWLERHQEPDGRWNFNHARPACKGQCPDPGTLDAPNAATALALLPYLGTGYSQRQAKYRKTVTEGLKFLRTQLARSNVGLFERNTQPIPAHALGALALCEASEGGRDKTGRAAALAATNFLLATQNADGGWGPTPKVPPTLAADASEVIATAWCVYALRAAKGAGLTVPDKVFKDAAAFLEKTLASDKSGFQRGPDTGGADPFATAHGMFCSMCLGWPREQPELTAYVGGLAKAGPASNGRFYLNFLQGQVMREASGPAWPAWNTALRDHLVGTQQTEGHAAGSWHTASSDWGNRLGGRLFCTALGALALEVYYRNPPQYPSAN